MTDESLDPEKIIARLDAERETPPALLQALKMFNDDLPFNEYRSWEKVSFWRKFEAMSRFEIGKELILIHEHLKCKLLTANAPGALEGCTDFSGTGMPFQEGFARRLTEFASGLSMRSAYEYMVFARKAAQSPKLQALGQGKNYKKALLLAQQLNEEEIKYLSETGDVRGLNLKQIEGMKLEDLQKALKKTETENGQLAKNNASLKKRLEALEAADEDVNKGRKLLEAGDKLLTDGLATLAKADFMLLRRDAAAVAIGRDLIAKVRRIADHLEAEMFGQ